MTARPSKARALREYFLDQSGFYLNRGCSGANLTELRREARENYARAVKEAKGRVGAIRKICTDCVGGDADGPHTRLVRECEMTDCPLHPVRPWQRT